MKPGEHPARLVILISGRGSNLAAFIDACQSGELNAEIALVLSNRPQAAGLELATQAGITTSCVDHLDFETREAFDRAIVDELAPVNPDAVILAGFMRILTPEFVRPYTGRLFNIHPSLLPKYPGLNTHQRAIDAGDAEAGATVHFVTQELDGGPPILHAAEPIREGDNAEDLANRVRAKEHLIYPLALSWFIEGRLALRDGSALLDGEPLPPGGLRFESPSD